MSQQNKLLLSIFSGIDLLGKAFEQNGFTVLKHGDKNLCGTNIETLNPPAGIFDGIIGGPPCQDFSRLNRKKGNYGHQMLEQYQRIVTEAQPNWYLMENVIGVPTFKIEGYREQRFHLDLIWFSNFTRLRVFQFGSKNGKLLNPMVGIAAPPQGGVVTGKDNRSFQTICEIQGLPKNFNLPFLSLKGKKQAVANAVPMQLGNYISNLINKDYYQEEARSTIEEKNYGGHGNNRRCKCPCKRILTGKKEYFNDACRKRAQRIRDKQTAQTP